MNAGKGPQTLIERRFVAPAFSQSHRMSHSKAMKSPTKIQHIYTDFIFFKVFYKVDIP